MSQLTRLSDADLWQRLGKGHEHAFTELFTRHHKPIYNYCFRRTANWSVAEDLMSGTFLELWRRRSEMGPLRHESALPLIYGISANLLRNQRRSLRRRAKAVARLESSAHAEQQAVVPTDEQIADVDLARKAVAAVGRLKPADRDIVTLRVFEELSYAEIAEALSISEGTVASRISRAQQKLADDPVLAPGLTRLDAESQIARKNSGSVDTDQTKTDSSAPTAPPSETGGHPDDV